jgi:hypothetical protein
VAEVQGDVREVGYIFPSSARRLLRSAGRASYWRGSCSLADAVAGWLL